MTPPSEPAADPRPDPGTPPPGARTQSERRARSQRGLLDAATELIAERGSANLTLAEVSLRAGYSRGMVRERFGSKHGLMEAVIADIQERFVEVALSDAVGDRRGLQAVEACVDATLRSLDGRGPLGPAFVALIGESVALDPALRTSLAQVSAGYRRRLARYFEEAQATGEMGARLAPKDAAMLLVGLLVGLATQFLIDREAASIDDVISSARGMLQSAALVPDGDR
ncbi:MAG: helix-turn-helix domain-containing protein [Myxococcota bacterium]